jgi:hypothetical protein
MKTKKRQETAAKVIKALGGVSSVARICAVRVPSVCEWRHNGLPIADWMFLHAKFPDVVPAPPLPYENENMAA